MKTIMGKVSGVGLGCLLCLGGLLLSACDLYEEAPRDEEYIERYEPENIDYDKRKTLFGEGGLNFFGDDKPQGGGGGVLGVNSFLWRASLDTISFMPVTSADPFGGVIITDWHAPDESPSERFKLNVYILGRTLRADGIRVAVFRQVQIRGGTWKDASVPDETGTKIEDAILMKARQLRNQSLRK